VQQKHPLHRPFTFAAGCAVRELCSVVVAAVTERRPAAPPDERDTEVQRGPVEPGQSANHMKLVLDRLRRVLLVT
jgi:hypothetical protein